MSEAKEFPTEAVGKILGISMSPAHGGLVSFKGATWDQIKELVLLGAADPEDAQNSSPTIAEFLNELEGCKDQIRFIGYVIVPPRSDARVSVEGFQGYNLSLRWAFELLKNYYQADDVSIIETCHGIDVTFWWD